MPAKRQAAKPLTSAHYKTHVMNGDRVALGRALTLIESTKGQDRLKAEKLLESILTHTGNSIRIGITGAPGVGKSTFIEAFGKLVTSLGKKIAVLTIDPSSQKTKGSILGDKTRMEELSRDPLAFIRPTPAGIALGGVAHTTQESILLCEAAGYEIIVVETVGVGQSEIAVRGMVDFFLLLMLAGAGDELQGIKKGIMEMADGVVITKADGDNFANAKQAQASYNAALHIMQQPLSGWSPKVLVTSATANTGIREVWDMIESFRVHINNNGFFAEQRRSQLLSLFYSSLEGLIKKKIQKSYPGKLAKLENQILKLKISPIKAARLVFKK